MVTWLFAAVSAILSEEDNTACRARVKSATRGGRLDSLSERVERAQTPRGLVCLERERFTSQIFDTLKSRCANGSRPSRAVKPRKGDTVEVRC
jgi:hypothetical protein